jgi:hypothetical protein
MVNITKVFDKIRKGIDNITNKDIDRNKEKFDNNYILLIEDLIYNIINIFAFWIYLDKIDPMIANDFKLKTIIRIIISFNLILECFSLVGNALYLF